MIEDPDNVRWPSLTMEDALAGVGKGWTTILLPLVNFCLAHNIQILQVKEKFGGLRFYTARAHDQETADTLDKMCREAEEAAEKTCEFCGAPGHPREGGWIKTLCNACDAKREQDYIAAAVRAARHFTRGDE